MTLQSWQCCVKHESDWADVALENVDIGLVPRGDIILCDCR